MDASVLAWIAAAVPLLYYVQQTWGLLRLDLKVGTNDPKFASDTFIELLNAGRRTMLICDDGNDMEGSIYNSQVVVDAVGNRLEDNRELRLLCLFNSEEETLFTRRFAGHPQVAMKRGMQPRREIHFKIIDGGEKGYVSSHRLGANERRYRLYNCSRTPKRIRDAALGRHVQDMQALFPQVEVAVA